MAQNLGGTGSVQWKVSQKLHLYDSIMWHNRKGNYRDRKQIRFVTGLRVFRGTGCPGTGEQLEGTGTVLYLRCRGIYMTVCICQNSEKCLQKRENSLDVNYNLKKKKSLTSLSQT